MTKPDPGAAGASLIDEADADRRRAPELDLTQRAVPTPEQNERARSNPAVAPIFDDMLRDREAARVAWIADCALRDGVSWSGLSHRDPPPVLLRTFDQMIDMAIAETARRAAYAVSPAGLLMANMGSLEGHWPNVLSLAGEVRSCVSRGLDRSNERAAARQRLQEAQEQLKQASWAISKSMAVLDVLDAEGAH